MPRSTVVPCLTAASVALVVCIFANFSYKNTIFFVLLIGYLPSYLDGAELSGDRYWPAFAQWCRVHGPQAPCTLEFEEDVDPEKQYIFCTHPHGLMSAHHGAMLDGSSKPSFHDYSPMHKRRDLGASVIFRIPVYREYLLWLGTVDASRSTANKMLTQGLSLGIVVGGITEQMLTKQGEHTIYVKRRKGHIRLAIKHGVPLVPAYVFGETDLYTHSDFLLSFRQELSRKLNFAAILGHGPSKLNPLKPYQDVELHMVFGKPIPVDKVENPTQEEIDAVHDKYVKSLIHTFDTYKTKYGYQDKTLYVV